MTEEQRVRGISAATLKRIALVVMFFNHICASYFIFAWTGEGRLLSWLSNAHWYLTRGAFVIYAFLIAEGMHYTKNREKYLLRLLIFAFISEIPFDLCFSRTMFDWSAQNVYFDLFAGAACIYLIDKMKEKCWGAFLVLAACIVSEIGHFDYSSLGILLIVCFYFLREKKVAKFIVGACILFFGYFSPYLSYLAIPAAVRAIAENALCELHGILAFPLLILYNGTRGRQLNKYFFYGFYPGHLLLIWGIIGLVLKGVFA